MTEDPHEAGRIEGKIDLLIENQSRFHTEQMAFAKRMEDVEQSKANKSEVSDLSERLGELESFKNSVKGVLIVASTLVTALGAWIAKKLTGH